MTDVVRISEEQYKLDIITKVITKEIKLSHAAKLLCVTPRQLRRLKLAVKTSGATGIIHGLKKKKGNHHIAPAV